MKCLCNLENQQKEASWVLQTYNLDVLPIFKRKTPRNFGVQSERKWTFKQACCDVFYLFILIFFLVPMDMDVKMKAVLMGACILIVSLELLRASGGPIHYQEYCTCYVCIFITHPSPLLDRD